MTKIQKQKHVDAIHQLVESSGYVANRWGKYHKDNIKIDGVVKIRFGARQ